MYSVAACLIWCRLVYYFRLFRGMGYNVRMLIEVCIDLRYFTILFFLSIIGFAHAYLLIEQNDVGSPGLIGMWNATTFMY